MGAYDNNANRAFTPSEEEQLILILKGQCPHNKGWHWIGHGHNDDTYKCALCKETRDYQENSMHPLLTDLSGLTDDELHKKRAELSNRLMFAYRMGHGDMIGQIQLVMGDYDMEVQRRNQKMLDDLEKNSKTFKDKIDIK